MTIGLFKDSFYKHDADNPPMVKTERTRYIGFEIASELRLSRKDMIGALQKGNSAQSGADLKLWLIVFDGNRGIVRCPHTKKDDAVKFLNSIKSVAGKSAWVRTLTASGTIRTVKEKLESGKRTPPSPACAPR
jgi:RNase P/RNase MRP subunit POP5